MVDSTPEVTASIPRKISYVIDTNVLIHDPNAILNFEEHHVALPMTVLEELDKLKSGKHSVAAECRQAIRMIDKLLGDASPKDIETGIAIARGKGDPKGSLSILTSEPTGNHALPGSLNDNRIINQALELGRSSSNKVVLVTKDINMRLKARACGLEAEDYSSDQLVDDIDLLSQGFHKISGSLWDMVSDVETRRDRIKRTAIHTVTLNEPFPGLSINEFVLDGKDVVAWVKQIDGDRLVFEELSQAQLLSQEAWGLTPRDVHQAIALKVLLDPDIHLVNLSGSAGS